VRLLATKRFLLRCAKYTTAGTALDVTGTTDNKLLVDTNVSTANQTLFNALDGRYLSALALDVDNISVFGRLLTDVELSTDVATLFGNFAVNNSLPTTADGHPGNDVVVRQWDNYGLYLNRTGNPVLSGLVQLNGHDRFSVRDGNYLNYVQPW
jgi:hypothetical protein